MSNKIAVRFVYNSSNVDFYDNEINEIIIHYNHRITIYNTLENYYGIYRIGTDSSNYKIIDIDFNIKYGNENSTLTKIETIYNQVTNGQPDILTCYYKYAISTSTAIQVKMIRQGMQWNYFNGASLSNYDLPITFVETKPEGVGMLYSPMITLASKGA